MAEESTIQRDIDAIQALLGSVSTRLGDLRGSAVPRAEYDTVVAAHEQTKAAMLRGRDLRVGLEQQLERARNEAEAIARECKSVYAERDGARAALSEADTRIAALTSNLKGLYRRVDGAEARADAVEVGKERDRYRKESDQARSLRAVAEDMLNRTLRDNQRLRAALQSFQGAAVAVLAGAECVAHEAT